MAGPRLLSAFAESYPNAFFVEVGSNDGEHDDHLRPLILSQPWRGLMIEPVPYVFDRLTANYGGLGRITLVNTAIADRDGELPFFHLREATETEQVPSWWDGTGSFSRETLLNHGDEIPGIEKRIVERSVPCMTFATLCAEHGVDQLDLLLIDTEGYDWEILKQVDLAALRPRLVIYEHFHLDDETRAVCRRHLAEAGYETLEEGFDTFALDTRSPDALTALWRDLQPAVAAVSVHDRGA